MFDWYFGLTADPRIHRQKTSQRIFSQLQKELLMKIFLLGSTLSRCEGRDHRQKVPFQNRLEWTAQQLNVL
jgi:hypothetical protein